MEITKNFQHTASELKWYSHWLDKNYFRSEPDEREPYTIVMPPPNVTGMLHMGHCLNNTIQDVLIRHARMHGKNACWVPGTDHASIATEAKVVQMLREQGISKSSLNRDEFLQYAWEWKEKYGGIILKQLRRLGCSCDWQRTAFTMDDDYYNSVINVFIDLYNKGLIYRGLRMINWDVKAKTALSDEEVIYREVNGKLYYIKYQLSDVGYQVAGNGSEPAYITIATTRPETILGDTAICVHPDDERYKALIGKTVLVPLINRPVPIIADDYVDKDFGTGALKITPAHDMNDYQLGVKHNLEVINILHDDGTLNEDAQLYIGEERIAVRKKIAAELQAKRYLVKVEDYTNQVGFSERTNEIVEPRLSLQWWLSMKKLSEPALKAVMDDAIKFFPPKFKNLYRHWMENIKDWCISRQLWWGHRIPAWYDEGENFVVAATKEDAFEQFKSQKSKVRIENIRQDEDVLDTWFSSWLWPFETFHGLSNPGNNEAAYYYPTNTLVTAPEIIFFWVARMIMSGFEYMHEKPFSDVYFTGIVRDEFGRKMSKQLGNSPDLLGLIDKYGADAVRFGTLISSPAGNDLLFDVKEESTLKQGSFFINKIWNAMKLVKMWEEKSKVKSQKSEDYRESSNVKRQSEECSIHNSQFTIHGFAVDWFDSRLNKAKAEIEKLYSQFKLSEALKTIYSLIWDDFCSWYLEWIKPGFNEPMEAKIYDKTIEYFDELLLLLHPFMPFVSEEIYHLLTQRNDDLCIKQATQTYPANDNILQSGYMLKNLITGIRDARNKNQLKPKDEINLHIQAKNKQVYNEFESILKKQVNARKIMYVNEAVSNAIIITLEQDKLYIISDKKADSSVLKNDLLKDLDYQNNFLQSVQKKLSNERFVQNAKPEVVAAERKKQSDAEARIKTIEESLANL